MISLLISVLVLLIILLVVDQLDLPSNIRTIVNLIIGLIFLIWLLNSLGTPFILK